MHLKLHFLDMNQFIRFQLLHLNDAHKSIHITVTEITIPVKIRSSNRITIHTTDNKVVA